MCQQPRPLFPGRAASSKGMAFLATMLLAADKGHGGDVGRKSIWNSSLNPKHPRAFVGVSENGDP